MCVLKFTTRVHQNNHEGSTCVVYEQHVLGALCTSMVALASAKYRYARKRPASCGEIRLSLTVSYDINQKHLTVKFMVILFLLSLSYFFPFLNDFPGSGKKGPGLLHFRYLIYNKIIFQNSQYINMEHSQTSEKLDDRELETNDKKDQEHHSSRSSHHKHKHKKEKKKHKKRSRSNSRDRDRDKDKERKKRHRSRSRSRSPANGSEGGGDGTDVRNEKKRKALETEVWPFSSSDVPHIRVS